MDARLVKVVEKLTGQESESSNIFKVIGFVFAPHSDSNSEVGNFTLISEKSSGTLNNTDVAMMALVSAALQSDKQAVSFTLQDDGKTIDKVVVTGFYD